MRKLHVIMPMAGEGSRFKQVGINIPKPLIKVDGTSLFIKSLSSIKDSFNFDDLKVTCIIQSKHDVDNKFSKAITNELHSANIVVLPKLTNGAVETCLSAMSFIDDNEAILIMDCDLEWRCHNYTNMIKHLLEEDYSAVGGMLLSFKSDNPRYSYALVKDGIVVKTAEKCVISDNALVGAYYFNTSQDFIHAANKLLEESSLSEVKEYYVSLLYNYIINDGKSVLLYSVDSMNSFGTPEELDEYKHKSVHN